MKGCIVQFVVVPIAALLHGWLLMLGIGMLHDEWSPAIPTMRYSIAILTVLLLRGVFSSFTRIDVD